MMNKADDIAPEGKRSESEELFVRDLDKALSEQDVINLRRKIQTVMEPTRCISLASVQKWAAAAILVSVALFFWWQTGVGKLSPDKLYNNYYQTYEVVSLNRGICENSLKQEAMLKYASGNFSQAKELLLEVHKQNDADNEVVFYLSLSCMELQQYQEAKVFFRQLMENRSQLLFADAVQWYYALTLLQVGEKENACRVLKQMTEGDSKYERLAKKLLEELS